MLNRFAEWVPELRVMNGLDLYFFFCANKYQAFIIAYGLLSAPLSGSDASGHPKDAAFCEHTKGWSAFDTVCRMRDGGNRLPKLLTVAHFPGIVRHFVSCRRYGAAGIGSTSCNPD